MVRNWRGIGGTLARYAVAMAGPILSAAAQFALQFVLLRTLDQAAFGSFSLMMILAQLSWGAWSALLCAPLPILLQAEAARREQTVRSLFNANLLGAAAVGGVFVAIGLALGVASGAALAFGGYAAIALIRWFARAYGYASGTPARTVASDIAYSLTLVPGTVLLLHVHHDILAIAALCLLAAAAIGMLPFGAAFLATQIAALRHATLGAYRAVWREHSRWALLGVVTTELTANAHAYLVTIFLGPKALAPIAASALLIRPITVAMNALTEFERPRLARDIARADLGGILDTLRAGRVMPLGIWLATAAAAASVMVVSPRLIFPHQYDLATLEAGASLWTLVALIRIARMPDSALLQATGAFRRLAFASVWSSIVSVAAVLILLATAGAIWSIVGILIGEILFAIEVWKLSGRSVRRLREQLCPA